jgi:hypothetical protein
MAASATLNTGRTAVIITDSAISETTYPISQIVGRLTADNIGLRYSLHYGYPKIDGYPPDSIDRYSTNELIVVSDDPNSPWAGNSIFGATTAGTANDVSKLVLGSITGSGIPQE